MARRVSVITIYSDFNTNNGKSFQESGVVLCNQDYFHRISNVGVTSGLEQDSSRRVETGDFLQEKSSDNLPTEQLGRIRKRNIECVEIQERREPYDAVLVGKGLLKKTQTSNSSRKPKCQQATPQEEAETQKDKPGCSEENVEKCFETVIQNTKQNSFDNNLNVLKTFRRNSVMEQTSAKQDAQRVYSKSAKANNPQTTKSNSGEINETFLRERWMDSFERDTETIDIRVKVNQLPDIRVRNKTAKDKRSITYNSGESRASGDTTLRTRGNSLDGGTLVMSKGGIVASEMNMSISVSGLSPVWSNTESIKKIPGRYDVRHEYADSIEKKWFENFLREMKQRESGGHDGSRHDLVHGEKGGDEAFGFSDDELHKNSLFNQLRGEYELQFSNINNRTLPQNDGKFYDTNSNFKHLPIYQANNTEFRLPDQADDRFGFETVSHLTNHITNLSLEFGSTEAMVGKLHQIKRMTSETEQDEMKMMKGQNQTKGSNNANRHPNLTLTEIRALRLKLITYSEFQKVKLPIKGKRRFRQIAFVVMFALHFRTMMLNSRERKRKARAKRMKLQAQKDRNKMYHPFERNKHGKSTPKDEIDHQPEKKLSRYALELQRIMADYDERPPLIVTSSPRGSRRRHPSDPGPSRPKEFRITLPASCKTSLAKRKRKCNSAKYKRDANLGKHDCRMMQRKSTKSKVFRGINEDTGLIAEIKKQLNIKAATKTTVAKAQPQEIVIVKEDVMRGRSVDDIAMTKMMAIDLRSLLKDIHIPAKEIKIQIAERKMKRRGTKRLLALNEWEDKTEVPKVSVDRNPAGKDIQRRTWSYSLRRNSIYRSAMVRSSDQQRQKKTTPIYDEEILNLPSLVLEMRSCRYIRWTKKYQDILSRLEELECSAL